MQSTLSGNLNKKKIEKSKWRITKTASEIGVGWNKSCPSNSRGFWQLWAALAEALLCCDASFDLRFRCFFLNWVKSYEYLFSYLVLNSSSCTAGNAWSTWQSTSTTGRAPMWFRHFGGMLVQVNAIVYGSWSVLLLVVTLRGYEQNLCYRIPLYTGPEIYFTAELNAGVQYICTMAVRSRTVLERVFSIYSGILNTSKPFKFICQRNLSQAQATDAKKLRAMVNVL